MDKFVYYAASFVAVMFVLTLHEFSHAFVAYKCGDPTAKNNGRLTLNPLSHFDLTGLIMFIFVGFGWAKPVPINPYNFNNVRKGVILTSSAGVIVNYITAFLIYPVYILVATSLPADNYLYILLIYILRFIFAYSLSFAVFNLLPFYPLDGFNMLDGILRGRGKVINFLKKYGYMILLGLIIESFVCDILGAMFPVFYNFDILGYVMSFAVNIIGWPIKALWGLIL